MRLVSASVIPVQSSPIQFSQWVSSSFSQSVSQLASQLVSDSVSQGLEVRPTWLPTYIPYVYSVRLSVLGGVELETKQPFKMLNFPIPRQTSPKRANPDLQVHWYLPSTSKQSSLPAHGLSQTPTAKKKSNDNSRYLTCTELRYELDNGLLHKTTNDRLL